MRVAFSSLGHFGLGIHRLSGFLGREAGCCRWVGRGLLRAVLASFRVRMFSAALDRLIKVHFSVGLIGEALSWGRLLSP